LRVANTKTAAGKEKKFLKKKNKELEGFDGWLTGGDLKAGDKSRIWGERYSFGREKRGFELKDRRERPE